MTTITAATVLARYNYESTDFDPATSPDETTSLTNVEYIIDDVIDYINLVAGTSISNMSGTAGAKTVTVTSDQNAVIKILLPLMLRDAKQTTTTSTQLGPAGVSQVLTHQNTAFMEMLETAISKLEYAQQDPPIYIRNAPVQTDS